LDKYIGTGQQADEELLPETSAAAVSEPSFDQAALDQLLAMGFSENRCKRALMKTGHAGAEVAMNWLFEHMEDAGKATWTHGFSYPFIQALGLTVIIAACHVDIDDPITVEASSASEPSAEQVELLMGMGFSQAHAKKALQETVSTGRASPGVCS